MSMIETKGVTYYYSKSHPVLDGIDLRLDRGMMYVIFGPSGCGKNDAFIPPGRAGRTQSRPYPV